MPFKLPKYKYYFAVSDFIGFIISFFVSAYIINPNVFSNAERSSLIDGGIIALFFSIILIFFFQNNNLYKINVISTNLLQLISILRSFFYGTLTMIFIAFWGNLPFIPDSRRFIVLFLFLSLLILFVFRFLILRAFLLKFANSKFLKRNAVIIGTGKSGKLLATKLEVENNLGLSIIGFIDDGKKIGEEVISQKRVIGKVNDLNKIIEKYEVEEIILAIDNISYERLLEILDICNESNVFVKLTSELFEIVPRKIVTEKYSDISVINLSPQLNITLNYYIKRIIDYVGAILGLIVFSPLFLILAILIKTTSRGPVFYKQIRIGKNGKPFKFLKFRSMTVVEGEDEERKKMMLQFMKEGKTFKENSTKIVNEKRVTWIGKFIRKTSIDELPQLINVLKGEMSLVGPRPCLPYEYENYEEWQKKRLSVLPGCTGVWQVFGRTDVSFKDSVILDLFYINNMSPWLDLQLIIKTIPVMIFGKSGE